MQPLATPAALLDHALGEKQLSATQEFVLVSLLQCDLNPGVVCLGNIDGNADRDATRFDRPKETMLTVLQQPNDSAHIFERQPCLLSNFCLLVPALFQALDVAKQVYGTMLASSKILDEAHHQTILRIGIHHQSRYFLLSQASIGLKPSLSTDRT